MSSTDQTVLIIGGSSGIGKALAHKFAVSHSPTFKKVIVTGRKADTIAEVAAEDEKLEGIAFDPNELGAIPAFVKRMVEEKGVNCVVITAGFQQAIDFTDAATVDLDAFGAELHTNLTSPVQIVTHLLAAFQASKAPATIAVTTSGLAVVPYPLCPAYSASKAGLRAFLLTVRRQLEAQAEANTVNLIEILPPAVETPGFPKTAHGPPRVPLQEYVDDLFPRLLRGDEFEIGYGNSQDRLNTIGKQVQEALNKMPVKAGAH